MGSKRLPGKSLLRLGDKTVLEHVICRSKECSGIDDIVVATTIKKEDGPIASLCSRNGIHCYRGSAENVLDRYYKAAVDSSATHIVRITGDSPFLDPTIVNAVIRSHFRNKPDLTHFAIKKGVLLGVTASILNFKALEDVYARARSRPDKEHVTLYMFGHPEKYRINTIAPYAYMLRPYRVTLDTKEDYAVIRKVYDGLSGFKSRILAREIVLYLDRHPEIARINSMIRQRHL